MHVKGGGTSEAELSSEMMEIPELGNHFVNFRI